MFRVWGKRGKGERCWGYGLPCQSWCIQERRNLSQHSCRADFMHGIGYTSDRRAERPNRGRWCNHRLATARSCTHQGWRNLGKRPAAKHQHLGIRITPTYVMGVEVMEPGAQKLEPHSCWWRFCRRQKLEFLCPHCSQKTPHVVILGEKLQGASSCPAFRSSMVAMQKPHCPHTQLLTEHVGYSRQDICLMQDSSNGQCHVG